MNWLKIINSPFKLFNVKLYIGKIKIGLPYFYPRKWVKLNHNDIHNATIEELNKFNSYLAKNPESKLKPKDYLTVYNSFKNHTKPVPLKIGFSYCDLGYKTKWSDTDYRYEWSPVYSFVFFGYQIALIIGHEHVDHYWTSWLYYEHNTDKKQSKEERIKKCIKDFPQIYTVYSKGTKKTVNYYKLILKDKYLKYIE